MRNISNRTGNTQNKMKTVQYDFPSPKEFLNGKSFIDTLGQAEAEDLMERMLRFSLDAKHWVAPTLDELCAQLESENELRQQDQAIQERNEEKRRNYEKNARWNWIRRIFGNEVKEPKYEERMNNVPRITPCLLSPAFAVRGLQYMQEYDFIEVIDEDNTKYLKLTTKALDTLK